MQTDTYIASPLRHQTASATSTPAMTLRRDTENVSLGDNTSHLTAKLQARGLGSAKGSGHDVQIRAAHRREALESR
jgi:hypothetical protein